MNIDLVLTDADVERIAVAVLAKLKAEGGTVTAKPKETKAPTKPTEKVEDKPKDEPKDGPTREEVLAKLRALKDAKGEVKLNEVLHVYAPKWKDVKDEDLAKLLADVEAAIAAPAAADDDI
jgi:hypothetical protein